MKPYSFHREAEREYAEAAQYYARISPSLGVRFYEEIEHLIAEIRRRPLLYRLHSKGCRRHFSANFPFGLIYQDRPDELRILAVMPLHRNPEYWRHRPPVE